MARPKASDARDTRQDILDAALDLFAEEGFYGTSMRNIARAVGVREGSLYHHFESKERLFEVLLEKGGEVSLEQVVQLLPIAETMDLQASFERMTLALLEHFSRLRERKLFRVFMSDGLRLAAHGRWNYWERAGVFHAPMVLLMHKLLAAGRVSGASPELLTLEYVSPLIMWRQLQVFSPEDHLVTDFRTFAREHVQQFLAGATGAGKPNDRSTSAPAEPSRPRRGAR